MEVHQIDVRQTPSNINVMDGTFSGIQGDRKEIVSTEGSPMHTGIKSKNVSQIDVDIEVDKGASNMTIDKIIKSADKTSRIEEEDHYERTDT
jgi:hypothetical protein